ncbi:hypothetical protein Tco_0819178 [Tanacetum coccineum]|uniref:Uncharacterized protein n=1 Tax=Tanacetum coccineum TaxID=301880 RepID=A0ABQ5A7K6_9ASTR
MVVTAVSSSLRSLKPKCTIESRAKRSSINLIRTLFQYTCLLDTMKTMNILRVICIIVVVLPEHPSDTDPTSNKLYASAAAKPCQGDSSKFYLVLRAAYANSSSGALLLQSLLIDNQEKKRRSTYSTTAFRRSNEEKNFSVRREAECSVIEAEDKEKGEREAILIVLVPPKGSVLDLVVKNLTETIFFALRNRSNNSGLRASTTIGYLTLGESGREGAASRRRHPLRFAKESCGAVKGSRWGSRLSWSPPTCGRGGELILRCQGARRRPQVEATDALVIPVDSLLPVRACCHAGKSGAFGLFLISKVARGRKMRIQSRRSGRMVEESMDSLGIDSRWLDIRVTTGREEERSTTELLATSCKGKDKTTFRTFLLVQTFE